MQLFYGKGISRLGARRDVEQINRKRRYADPLLTCPLLIYKAWRRILGEYRCVLWGNPPISRRVHFLVYLRSHGSMGSSPIMFVSGIYSFAMFYGVSPPAVILDLLGFSLRGFPSRLDGKRLVCRVNGFALSFPRRASYRRHA